MDRLEELRNHIDEIDDQLIELFQQRMETVEAIAEAKKDLERRTDDPEREARIIARHLSQVQEKWQPYYESFQKELFALSKAYQDKLRQK